jgi:hypothetical protein
MVKSFAFIFEGTTLNNGEKQNTNDKGKKLVQILNHFLKHCATKIKHDKFNIGMWFL